MSSFEPRIKVDVLLKAGAAYSNPAKSCGMFEALKKNKPGEL